MKKKCPYCGSRNTAVMYRQSFSPYEIRWICRNCLNNFGKEEKDYSLPPNLKVY